MSFLPSIIAAIVSYIICRVGEGRYMLSHPNDRSSHVKPTSNIGGVAMYMGILFGLIFGYFTFTDDYFTYTLTVFSCASLLWLIGFIDDIHGLSAKVRLFTQFIFALLIIFVFELELPLPQPISFLSIPLLAIGISGFINASNFSDGINGLWAGTVLVWLFFLGNLQAWDPTFIIILGAVLAYFILNFPKGRIFMGDSGSTFLGALVITYALTMTNSIAHLSHAYYPLLIMALSPFAFVFSDVLITLIRRVLTGHHPFHAHKEHYMQKMVHILGLSHGWVSCIYIIGSLMSTIILGMFGFRGDLFWAIPSYVFVQGCFFLTIDFLVCQKSKK